MDRREAAARAWTLFRTLEQIGLRDSEQEVQGPAVPAIEALLEACRHFVVSDPVFEAIDGLMTPEAIADGSIRAIDAALVIQQLALALGRENPPASPAWEVSSEPSIMDRPF